jgi:hypothetical protein
MMLSTFFFSVNARLFFLFLCNTNVAVLLQRNILHIHCLGLTTPESEKFKSLVSCIWVYSASNRNEYQKHKNNVSGE